MTHDEIKEMDRHEWHKWKYNRMIELVIAGYKPCPSGSGDFLYWEKDGKLDHPEVPELRGLSLSDKGAVQISQLWFFWDDVELRRKQMEEQASNLPLDGK